MNRVLIHLDGVDDLIETFGDKLFPVVKFPLAAVPPGEHGVLKGRESLGREPLADEVRDDGRLTVEPGLYESWRDVECHIADKSFFYFHIDGELLCRRVQLRGSQQLLGHREGAAHGEHRGYFVFISDNDVLALVDDGFDSKPSEECSLDELQVVLSVISLTRSKECDIEVASVVVDSATAAVATCERDVLLGQEGHIRLQPWVLMSPNNHTGLVAPYHHHMVLRKVHVAIHPVFKGQISVDCDINTDFVTSLSAGSSCSFLAVRALLPVTRLRELVLHSMKKWAYNLAGFNKYGLMRDDCLYETQDVQEALRRLPAHVVDERTFRMVRAMQLSLQKSILPKEEWTKYEDDVLYLTPIVKQVEKERKEREAWEANY
ncbi:hypothetical protein MSG28_011159 [Choristoneura fumiferana]|uniref:Uncharacterized protein n=1 Tax=Choristoneura fumiferana TaxID=7141 RepID=A0ACC0KR65_CHOFU|nr:hypothetical protein MSG28_011159 [Choristoneura fumiferana]